MATIGADLVRQMAAGDRDAFSVFYDRYAPVVFPLILRIVRDTGIAEDLVQETFLRVWNRVHAFDSQKGSIGPWLLAVARNRAIDYLRSAGGRERNAFEFEETDHPSLYTDMEKDILRSDKARVVKAALEKLSANQRQVIELAYFEGLSQTEMAERPLELCLLLLLHPIRREISRRRLQQAANRFSRRYRRCTRQPCSARQCRCPGL